MPVLRALFGTCCSFVPDHLQTSHRRVTASHCLSSRCPSQSEATWRHTRVRLQVRSEATKGQPHDGVKANAEVLRALPLVAGAFGITGVLVNRLVSGIAPVVDASSSQSRADVLVILLSAVLLLSGLQWLALKPKTKPPVELDGVNVSYIQQEVAAPARAELQWVWQSLRECSTCQAVVVLHGGSCIAHLGAGRGGHNPATALPGLICDRAVQSGKGNYLANLALYPGRVEFTTFLPENTQAVVVQPIGNKGVLIAASNTQRGFTRLDQAWVATLADKLETSLEQVEQPQKVPS